MFAKPCPIPRSLSLSYPQVKSDLTRCWELVVLWDPGVQGHCYLPPAGQPPSWKGLSQSLSRVGCRVGTGTVPAALT